MKKGDLFNVVQLPKLSENTFDLSHDAKFTLGMGPLIPCLAMDVLPGDKINLSTEVLLRFMPLISPVMHRIKVTQHYFFVPNRILWRNWEEWITGNLDVEPPYISSTDPTANYGIAKGSLGDYFGLPVNLNWPNGENYGGHKINALPFAAYWKIYHEYYRDQNLEDAFQFVDYEPMLDLIDGDNTVRDLTSMATLNFSQGYIPHRAWGRDYLTSALPFAQKGDAVAAPLGQFALEYDHTMGGTVTRLNADGTVYSAGGDIVAAVSSGFTDVGGDQVDIDVSANHKVVPVGDGSVNIIDLRRAFKLQEWLELNARGGTRYKEHLSAHWDVKSSDARLQRPEYLGGSVQNVVISEVLATAQNTEAGVNVGNMAGHAISVSGNKQFSFYAEEHGWVIGIINVQPDSAYQDGLARKFTRMDRLDYAWPTFQHIGEQEILNKEVVMACPPTGEGSRDGTWGYIPRYSEYKFENSRVAGELRDTLKFWHLGRIFEDDLVPLNMDFIKVGILDDLQRIFAVEENFLRSLVCHMNFRLYARRKLARFGNPFL